MILQVSLQTLPDHVGRREGGAGCRHDAVAAVAVVVDHRQREQWIAHQLLIIIGLSWLGLLYLEVKWGHLIGWEKTFLGQSEPSIGQFSIWRLQFKPTCLLNSDSGPVWAETDMLLKYY